MAASYYAIDTATCSPTNLAACTQYTAPFVISGDGAHTVTFFSQDKAGNVEAVQSLPLAIGSAQPGPTTASVSGGTAGANGWYIASPSIALASTNASAIYYQLVPHGSPAPAGALPGTWIAYTGDFSASAGDVDLYAFSVGAGGTAEAPLNLGRFQVDGTAPTTTAVPDRSAGPDGGYAGPVTVALEANDGATGSGLAATYYAIDKTPSGPGDWTTYTGPFVVSGGGAHTVTFFSRDQAGNAETPRSVTVRIATQPGPTVKSLSGGAAGTNGWYTASPAIGLTSSNATAIYWQFVPHGSAAPSASLPGTWTTYGGTFQAPAGDADLYAFSVGAGGTAETPVNLGRFQIDGAAPTTTATPSGTSGGNGWYIGPVTVALVPDDGSNGSGVGATSYSTDAGATWQPYTAPFILAADGRYDLRYRAVDVAGNAEAERRLALNIDQTPPSVPAFGSFAASYYFGDVPAAPTCTATDALSGLASCVVTGYSAAVGAHTLTATARDNAGNVSTNTLTYTVLGWTTKGFYQPVDMRDGAGKMIVNTCKAGSTVPLKFEVFKGSVELKDVSVVKALTYRAASAPPGTPAAEIETVASGGTSLRFDATADQFIYNWKTPAAGTYVVTVTLQDGTTIEALFQTR